MLSMLLWSSSCSFCDLQHCCGEAPARFMLRNVVLVKLLLIIKTLTSQNCLDSVAFSQCNYRDNEELSNRGFVFARHSLKEDTERRLDKFNLCCISNVFTLRP